MGGAPEVKELEENIIGVHYDLPVPGNNNSDNSETKRLISKWRTWYDKSTKMLRELGYPIGYSIIVTNSDNLKMVYDVASRIRDTYSKLKERDKCNVLPSPDRIKIGVIRFKPATK